MLGNHSRWVGDQTGVPEKENCGQAQKTTQVDIGLFLLQILESAENPTELLETMKIIQELFSTKNLCPWV